MDETPFFEFLQRALAAVKREAPRAHAELLGHMRHLSMHLHVDGEARTLSVAADELVLDTESRGSNVALTTRRSTIAGLVTGEQTLTDALFQDDLFLRGSPGEIVVAHDALLAFVRGAVRAPSLPRLLDEYLGRSSRSEAPFKRESQRREERWPEINTK